MNDVYLGVDLGGTKLMIGEIDARGTILQAQKYPSRFKTQEEALSCIEDALDSYLSARAGGARGLRALGLGLVGRVDGSRGIWLGIDEERNEAIRAGERLTARYRLPCFVDNDVKCAASAEQRFGYGRHSDHFVYINVGTGIAAGIVTAGRIIQGSQFNAGEVGHTSAGVSVGVRCCCGRTDCVEAIAAGVGFDACARLLAPRYPGTLLSIPEADHRVNVAEVFEYAAIDPLCALLVENAAQSISNLIMNLIRVSDPDTVILGGGILCDGFLFEKILGKLNQHTIRFVKNGVMLTQLKPEYIGLIGACTMAMRHAEKEENHA